MHPLIWSAMEQRSAELDGPYQLMVIPLLVEKRSTDRVDRVLVVDCDEALQVRRLQSRDQSTSAQAKAILASQATRAERLAKADDVITNSSDFSALAKQVARLHTRYRALATEARA
jgi:dephospho-CoA kinase